jgi:hypothetical protein
MNSYNKLWIHSRHYEITPTKNPDGHSVDFTVIILLFDATRAASGRPAFGRPAVGWAECLRLRKEQTTRYQIQPFSDLISSEIYLLGQHRSFGNSCSWGPFKRNASCLYLSQSFRLSVRLSVRVCLSMKVSRSSGQATWRGRTAVHALIIIRVQCRDCFQVCRRISPSQCLQNRPWGQTAAEACWAQCFRCRNSPAIPSLSFRVHLGAAPLGFLHRGPSRAPV